MKICLSRRALALLLVSLSFGPATLPAAEFHNNHHRRRPAANEKITQIRDSYKKRFNQESVLRVDSSPTYRSERTDAT